MPQRLSLGKDAGAHFNWTSYAFLSQLTALTDLQLAHCSGALPLPWLTALPRLRRLYLKGNSPASTYQLIGLTGGHECLTGMTALEELYLGLVAFVEENGVPLLTSINSLLTLSKCK